MMQGLRDYLSRPGVGAMDESMITLKTFRYVRLTIVAMTVGLLASLVLERARAGCALGSVSAYYYTPARGFFTGGLIAIGVCLIALRDPDAVKDNLLNAAGLLAPMVALIPMNLRLTKEVGGQERPNPDATCIQPATNLGEDGNSFSLVTAGREDTIHNNFWSLMVVMFIASLALLYLIYKARRQGRTLVWTPSWWPLSAMVVLNLAVISYYTLNHPDFLLRMHFGSAILLFLLIAVYAVVDGIHAWSSAQRKRKQGICYVVLGLAIIVGCSVLKVCNVWPRYNTLLVELLGISLFLVFWVAQTMEFWDHPTRQTAVQVRHRVEVSSGAAEGAAAPRAS